MSFTVTKQPTGPVSRKIGSRSYTEVYQVISTDVVSPAEASFAVPVVEGQLYPFDTTARCIDISADWKSGESSRLVYLVTAKFDTGSGGSEQVEDEDPLNDRPRIAWGSRTVRLPVRMTNDDPPQAITNSAGETPDPLPEEDFQVLVYTFQHNVANYSEANARAYRGAINSDTFTLAGLSLSPFQARITNIAASNEQRNGTRYWSETVVVEVADDWRLILVDEGLRAVPVGGGVAGEEVYVGEGQFATVSQVTDAAGIPVERPVLLDGAGGVLKGGNPVLLTFNTAAKPLKAFAGLGLPTTNNP